MNRKEKRQMEKAKRQMEIMERTVIRTREHAAKTLQALCDNPATGIDEETSVEDVIKYLEETTPETLRREFEAEIKGGDDGE